MSRPPVSPAINTLYVVGECEHPNAAKLLIRFMMGGADGDVSGYKYFNTLGGWPVVSNRLGGSPPVPRAARF